MTNTRDRETVFIAIGEIRDEVTENLGVFRDLDSAQLRCDECPGQDEGDGRYAGRDFGRHLIEAWEVGAREPHSEWSRDTSGHWRRLTTPADMAAGGT